MKTRPFLEVGDLVQWRGCFGSEAPYRARVERIQICPPGSKYGEDVHCASWALVNAPREERHVVVDLSNGHWAYGTQLKPLRTPEDSE